MPNPEQQQPPAADPEKQLRERFEKTREMALWAQFFPAVRQGSHETGAFVTLPAGFLRLAVENLEQDPFIFSALRRRWNQIIDEVGMPALYKKPPPPEAWLPGQPNTATDEQDKALSAQFEGSQEYRLWQEFVAALKGLADSPAQTVDVPTGFLRIAAVDIERYPFRFAVLRDAWNALVDEMNLPATLRRHYE